MSDMGQLIARISQLEMDKAELLTALKLLWQETVLSGNSDAKDYGWPKAREATLAVIKKNTP